MLYKLERHKNKNEDKRVTVTAMLFPKQMENTVDALTRYDSLAVYVRELSLIGVCCFEWFPDNRIFRGYQKFSMDKES